MNPTSPEGQAPVVAPQEQAAQQAMINQVPGAPEQTQPQGMDLMHGGYTGVRVGEMANQIARLQAAGRTEEAAALTERLNRVSPPEAPKQ